MELIEQQAVINCLERTAKYYEREDADEWTKGIHYGLLHGVDNILDNVPTVEAVPMEKINEILDKFSKWLWSESEDVRGDQMIDIGYAEGYLRELFDWERKWEE